MSEAALYSPRPISRDRRTKAQMDGIRAEIHEVVEAGQPMTVRQVFYQLVSRGVIAKTETEYKHTVIRLLTELRREHVIPYDWVADNTRWMRKPQSYSSLHDMLKRQHEFYRRALWDDQDAYVEVWLEKDALAGVVFDVTAEWDVPLMVTRGYASESYLYSAADAITNQIADDKRAYVYYFGDYDPSGLNIPEVIERRLREMATGMFDNPADLHLDYWFRFERVAVTPEQITDWSLPTRPTKKAPVAGQARKGTDTRAKNFEGESVEVDAIPPDQLRELVEECITEHINDDVLERTRTVEKAERESLAHLVEEFRS